jgi:hypothetical protein
MKLFTIALFIASIVCSVDAFTKIVGGDPSDAGEFPYYGKCVASCPIRPLSDATTICSPHPSDNHSQLK